MHHEHKVFFSQVVIFTPLTKKFCHYDELRIWRFSSGRKLELLRQASSYSHQPSGWQYLALKSRSVPINLTLQTPTFVMMLICKESGFVQGPVNGSARRIFQAHSLFTAVKHGLMGVRLSPTLQSSALSMLSFQGVRCLYV